MIFRILFLSFLSLISQSLLAQSLSWNELLDSYTCHNPEKVDTLLIKKGFSRLGPIRFTPADPNDHYRDFVWMKDYVAETSSFSESFDLIFDDIRNPTFKSSLKYQFFTADGLEKFRADLVALGFKEVNLPAGGDDKWYEKDQVLVLVGHFFSKYHNKEDVYVTIKNK